MIKCQMIFYVKLGGEGFRRKSILVGGRNMKTSPTSVTYLSLVSRDSVRIALIVSALNGLNILACGIKTHTKQQNAENFFGRLRVLSSALKREP